MTKEKKIQEAYGVHYKFFKHFIDVNGWLDKLKIGHENLMLIIQLTNEIPCESQINNAHSIRPKSLQGIEENNGWIKIESEADFPKIKGQYYWFNRNTKLITLQHFNPKYIGNKITRFSHYQALQKPETPIY